MGLRWAEGLCSADPPCPVFSTFFLPRRHSEAALSVVRQILQGLGTYGAVLSLLPERHMPLLDEFLGAPQPTKTTRLPIALGAGFDSVRFLWQHLHASRHFLVYYLKFVLLRSGNSVADLCRMHAKGPALPSVERSGQLDAETNILKTGIVSAVPRRGYRYRHAGDEEEQDTDEAHLACGKAYLSRFSSKKSGRCGSRKGKQGGDETAS